MGFKMKEVTAYDFSGGMNTRADGLLNRNECVFAYNVLLGDRGGFTPWHPSPQLAELSAGACTTPTGGGWVGINHAGTWTATSGDVIYLDGAQYSTTSTTWPSYYLPIVTPDSTYRIFPGQAVGAWKRHNLITEVWTTATSAIGAWDDTYGTGSTFKYIPCNVGPVEWHGRLWIGATIETENQYNRIRYSHPGFGPSGSNWKEDDYIDLPGGVEIRSMTPWKDFLLIQTTNGIWIITGWDSNDFFLSEGLPGACTLYTVAPWWTQGCANNTGCYMLTLGSTPQDAFTIWEFDGKGFRRISDQISISEAYDLSTDWFPVSIVCNDRYLYFQVTSQISDAASPLIFHDDYRVDVFVYDFKLGGWVAWQFDHKLFVVYGEINTDPSSATNSFEYGWVETDAPADTWTLKTVFDADGEMTTNTTKDAVVWTRWLEGDYLPKRRRWGRANVVTSAAPATTDTFTVEVAHDFNETTVRTTTITRDDTVTQVPPGGLSYTAMYKFIIDGAADPYSFLNFSVTVKERQ